MPTPRGALPRSAPTVSGVIWGTRIYTNMYMHIHTVFIQICIYTYMCMYIYIYMIYLHLSWRSCALGAYCFRRDLRYVCIYICMHMYVHRYTYIYVQIFMYMYICTYMHIYIPPGAGLRSVPIVSGVTLGDLHIYIYICVWLWVSCIIYICV